MAFLHRGSFGEGAFRFAPQMRQGINRGPGGCLEAGDIRENVSLFQGGSGPSSAVLYDRLHHLSQPKYRGRRGKSQGRGKDGPVFLTFSHPRSGRPSWGRSFTKVPRASSPESNAVPAKFSQMPVSPKGHRAAMSATGEHQGRSHGDEGGGQGLLHRQHVALGGEGEPPGHVGQSEEPQGPHGVLEHLPGGGLDEDPGDLLWAQQDDPEAEKGDEGAGGKAALLNGPHPGRTSRPPS